MIVNNSLHNEYSQKHLTRQRFKGRARENDSVPHSVINTTVYESDKINVNKSAIKMTAGENPSGHLSFKGAPPVSKFIKEVGGKRFIKLKQSAINKQVESRFASKAKKLENTFGGKLATNKGFNWFLDRLFNNTLVAEAIYALGLTALLRPAAIYALPTKNKEDKKKNRYQIGQAISTGIIGLGLTFAISEPFKRGIKRLMENPAKYDMKKNIEYMSTHKGAFKETTNRLIQPVFLPVKAILTIMLIPPILKALFGLEKTKKSAGINPVDKAKIDYSFMNFKGDNKKVFANFAGTSTAQTQPEMPHSPSFKGNLSKLIVQNFKEEKGLHKKLNSSILDTIASGVGKIADTDFYKGLIEKFAKTNFMAHLVAGESVYLTGFYVNETARSKNIEKDQKLPLMLNQIIVTALCTVGAYAADQKIKDSLGKYAKTYKIMNYKNRNALAKDGATKLLPGRLSAITRLLAPIVIFTTIYRFIGPVLVTPIANALSNKIQANKKAKKEAKAAA